MSVRQFGNCYSKCKENKPFAKCDRRCSKKIYGHKNVDEIPCAAKCEMVSGGAAKSYCIKTKCTENFETKINNSNNQYMLIFIIIILFFIIKKCYNKK